VRAEREASGLRPSNLIRVMPAKGASLAVRADVIVAGGGVVGMAIAWRAAAAGFSVVVVDPGAGEAASLVAAGMLAPVSESMFGEDALLRLNLAALRQFPAFVAELEQASGQQVGLRQQGTLAVAYDTGDLAELARMTAFRRSAGLGADHLDARACRRLEPFLAPDVRGGVRYAGDWSLDNRRYLAALRTALRAADVRVVRGRVIELRVAGGRVSGVRLAGGEIDTVGGDAAVVAAGCWSGAIKGLPEALADVLRPVKGQLLRLRAPAAMPPVLGHTVRASVRGAEVYLVPRAGGEVVVGATSEERGYDRAVTAGAVHDLLHDAMNVVPAVSELTLAETRAGLRPGTPDNGPVLGLAGPAGLLIATGHYRNGILLSAATADAAVACLAGQPLMAEWEPFSPQRFAARAGAR
jgi:glycine oxidase